MHQESRTSHHSGELQGTSKRKVILAEARKGLEQQNQEEPSIAETAQHARFSKGFEVIVVRVIHNLAVVQSLVARIHDLKGTESRACQRVIQKDVPGATAHGGALALGHFERLER